jgi:hypothetical protein
VVWAVCAALSVQFVPAGPVASVSAATLAVEHGRDVQAALADQRAFERASSSPDTFGGLSGPGLLEGLRGKDVLVVFVESYGQVALTSPEIAPGVTAELDRATARLDRAGFDARSGWLDSSTFGGGSWLAHATLQSGLWIDSQPRYDQLMTSDRLTLTTAFGSAGWRTVSVNPADEDPWEAGSTFYDYDELYDQNSLGYEGPKFGWSPVPDQYTLAAFAQRELTPGHDPLMAEIDLTSSHWPWTPLPHMIPTDTLGDGSVFDPMPAQGRTAEEVGNDEGAIRQLYGQSIEYSLDALYSWAVGLHDDDLVLVVLGDHQPVTSVSGADPSHQVPISVVAADPAVLDGVAGWHWQDGLVPGPHAPVWPMDAFRDRFLDAFTPSSQAQAAPPR